MRLDAALGHKARVWHCGEHRLIKKCRWVDDQTHRYGVWSGLTVGGSIVVDVYQAKQIVIVRGAGLVLIDPDQPEVQTEQIFQSESITA